MRTEQQVYEELLQIESDLECKLHDVKIAIKVLHGLKWPESTPVVSEPMRDLLEAAQVVKPIKVKPVEPIKTDNPKHTGCIAKKVCIDCGLPYQPTSNVQKRCEECRSKKVTKSTKPPE